MSHSQPLPSRNNYSWNELLLFSSQISLWMFFSSVVYQLGVKFSWNTQRPNLSFQSIFSPKYQQLHDYSCFVDQFNIHLLEKWKQQTVYINMQFVCSCFHSWLHTLHINTKRVSQSHKHHLYDAAAVATPWKWEQLKLNTIRKLKLRPSALIGYNWQVDLDYWSHTWGKTHWD